MTAKIFGIGMCPHFLTTLEMVLSENLGFTHLNNTHYFEHVSPILRSYCAQVEENGSSNLLTPEQLLACTAEMSKRMDAHTDFPWMYLYKECYELYPDARFILTKRKSDDTVAKSEQNFWLASGSPVNNVPSAQFFRDRYNNHNKAVREFFKDKDVKYIELCWECGDSWERLCGFLEVPIPDGMAGKPFPHWVPGGIQTNYAKYYEANKHLLK